MSPSHTLTGILANDSGARARSARLAVAVLVLAASLAAPAARAASFPALHLTMENDLLVTDQDDLYTFAIDLELQRGAYTYAFRENAFTDRAAGVRFDESELTVGRELPVPRPWTVHAEAGLVHVGRGLFGERAQNAVHDMIGGEEVELPYAPSSLHGRAALVAQRSFAVGERLDVGPLVELETVPGLRSHAVLGAQAGWRPRRNVDVFLVAGARLTEASHRALDRHALGAAPIGRLGVVLYDSIHLTWTYNDYGDGREHLGLGYRVPTRGRRGGSGRSVERAGADTPVAEGPSGRPAPPAGSAGAGSASERLHLPVAAARPRGG